QPAELDTHCQAMVSSPLHTLPYYEFLMSPMKPAVHCIAAAENPALAPIYTLGCLLAHARSYDSGRLNQSITMHPLHMIDGSDEHQQGLLEIISPGTPSLVAFSSYLWNHKLNLL